MISLQDTRVFRGLRVHLLHPDDQSDRGLLVTQKFLVVLQRPCFQLPQCDLFDQYCPLFQLLLAHLVCQALLSVPLHHQLPHYQVYLG